MQKRKNTSTTTEGSKSLRKAIFFCVAVILLIFFSLLFRLTLLIKEGTYDGSNRYTLSIIKDGTQSSIVSFDPEQNTVGILRLSGSRQNKTIQQLISVPIDGSITLSSDMSLSEDPSSLLLSILLKPGLKKEKTNEVDIAQLILFSKKLAPKDISLKEIKLPAESSQIDEVASQLFADAAIVDERISIEIINSTDVPGLGRRLERLIKNTGGNVVAVSNATTVLPKSKIVFFKKESYTSMKLKQILQYMTEPTTKQSIAEITIYIGDDQRNSRSF